MLGIRRGDRPADRHDHQHLGIPVYRDVNLPSGTALAGAWSDCDIYIGSEFRIDVSSEAGSRFDQNITGFRAEEEFGFNAEPYVRTGKFVKILGLYSAGPSGRAHRTPPAPASFSSLRPRVESLENDNMTACHDGRLGEHPD